MDKVLNGMNDFQIIEGIEATVRRSPDRTNQPLFFIKAKGWYSDCHVPGRGAD
jgi:hypothetical protein